MARDRMVLAALTPFTYGIVFRDHVKYNDQNIHHKVVYTLTDKVGYTSMMHRCRARKTYKRYPNGQVYEKRKEHFCCSPTCAYTYIWRLSGTAVNVFHKEFPVRNGLPQLITPILYVRFHTANLSHRADGPAEIGCHQGKPMLEMCNRGVCTEVRYADHLSRFGKLPEIGKLPDFIIYGRAIQWKRLFFDKKKRVGWIGGAHPGYKTIVSRRDGPDTIRITGTCN